MFYLALEKFVHGMDLHFRYIQTINRTLFEKVLNLFCNGRAKSISQVNLRALCSTPVLLFAFFSTVSSFFLIPVYVFSRCPGSPAQPLPAPSCHRPDRPRIGLQMSTDPLLCPLRSLHQLCVLQCRVQDGSHSLSTERSRPSWKTKPWAVQPPFLGDSPPILFHWHCHVSFKKHQQR